jgi:hypothetical protein
MIKVDFIRFKYPFAESTIVTDGIRLANIRDMACMKIDAIMGRGRKKDFCDLYYLLKWYSLSEIMEGYKNMYPHLIFTSIKVLRGLMMRIRTQSWRCSMPPD